jgi:hypothetical protein
MLAGSMPTRVGRPQKDLVDRERPDLGDARRVERLQDRSGLLGRVGDPACDGRVIGAILGEEDAEQVLDLAGADTHGEGGHRQASPGGLVEHDGRGGAGSRGRGRGWDGRLQPLLDLAGVLIDGLPAATGLLGPVRDGPVASREDGGGVADGRTER